MLVKELVEVQTAQGDMNQLQNVSIVNRMLPYIINAIKVNLD